MNAKITIEALVPVGYTDDRLADHVRRVLPDAFRVFDIKVEQTEAAHGEEVRREEFRQPTNAELKAARKLQLAKEQNGGGTIDTLVEEVAKVTTP